MFIRILLYLFMYSFLGWCAEVIYAALKEGEFVNRGFLNGPICPIYGFGAVAVVVILRPFHDNLFILFAGSIVVTSLIELITGFVLEKVFKHRWWDYSDEKFNIGGYICPIFSLMWGIACLVIVAYINPIIVDVVNIIPETAAKIILTILMTLFTVDFIATTETILKMNKRLERIEELTGLIRRASDDLGENLAGGTIALMKRKEELEKEIDQKRSAVEEELAEIKQAHMEIMKNREQYLINLKKAYNEILEARFFGHKRILKAFPGIKSSRHKDAMEKLRNHLLRSHRGEKINDKMK
ncbi:MULTISPECIES: putative ABC transporter permease [unclassified Sedimentibacter]|uniref:putative ABC transporter permease n=1 Tax=unclassified Sedimentibacter TaxID=2649220 RepID=UPI0027E03FE1|nr:hypothetical protein [Sedimentibacter sp. MB35-C1]WMJ75983.1 hypothetical protein RBQ61_10100 [Sedimentibacter sp. MB35-C1]